VKESGAGAVTQHEMTIAGKARAGLAAVAMTTVLAGPAACGGEETAGTTSNDAAGVVRFVERFMEARQQGLPADQFLSAEAAAAYEEHETGLWLYDDSLPGGPGGEYKSYSIAESGAEGPSRRVVVRIDVAWDGDAEPSEMVEALTVRAGKVIEARRTDDPGDDGLPLAVAEMREDIYHATRGDWKALRALLDPKTFSYSFGESGDPIGYWRELEEEGHLPVVGDILPGVLHTRFGVNEGIYVWPSAAAKLPQDWTEADIQAMRDAGYRDRDIRAFEEKVGGYAGWRAGIRADGTWLYFISGD
jgi:hypothetical protein